jgi:hypothetical protein
VAVFTAAFGAVQYARMPAETRPLFRHRRILAAAVGLSYGSILVALVVAPASALTALLLLVLFARFAGLLLRRRRPGRAGRAGRPARRWTVGRRL